MTERYVHRNNKNNEHRIVTPTIQFRSLAAYEPFRVCFSPVGSVGGDPHLYAPAWKAKIHEEMTK